MTMREQAVIAKRDELLTVKEYATLTRTHVDVVYRRCRTGRQQGAIRAGGQWLIDLAAGRVTEKSAAPRG